MLLNDLITGDPLAIMDSTHLTVVRTGLAGALGADVLARQDTVRAAIIGAGVQSQVQLESLARVRPLESVSVFHTQTESAARFCRSMSSKVTTPIRVADSIAEAVGDADIIVTATGATKPFLFAGMVKPGAHITTLGPDQPRKCEVDAGLIRASTFVCDDRDLAVEMGAIGGAGLDCDAIHAELGDVIGGTKKDRTSARDITVFGAVGLAFQDFAAAWLVYQKALETNSGLAFDLLA